MSQPPQGPQSHGPDGRPPSGDQPSQGSGWGQPPAPPSGPQPGQQPGFGGWGQQPGAAGPADPAVQPGAWGAPGAAPRSQPAPGGWGGQPAAPGGWGQQPGQPAQPGQAGGWGGAPAPGYGQPAPVGGFGGPGQPPHLGGPGWGGPGAPGGDGKKKNVVIALVAGLVLALVVAVVLTVTLTGGDDDSSTIGSDRSTSSAPGPTSSSSGGFGSTPSSSPAVPAGTLVDELPLDFFDCTEQATRGDGDLEAASCGAALTQPGPTSATFARYPDQESLDGAFQSDVDAAGLTPFTGAADCSVNGYAEWTFNGSVETGGLLGCGLTPEGNAFVYWTDYDYLVEGMVTMPGTTQDDVLALYEWWTINSNFQ